MNKAGTLNPYVYVNEAGTLNPYVYKAGIILMNEAGTLNPYVYVNEYMERHSILMYM